MYVEKSCPRCKGTMSSEKNNDAGLKPVIQWNCLSCGNIISNEAMQDIIREKNEEVHKMNEENKQRETETTADPSNSPPAPINTLPRMPEVPEESQISANYLRKYPGLQNIEPVPARPRIKISANQMERSKIMFAWCEKHKDLIIKYANTSSWNAVAVIWGINYPMVIKLQIKWGIGNEKPEDIIPQTKVPESKTVKPEGPVDLNGTSDDVSYSDQSMVIDTIETLPPVPERPKTKGMTTDKAFQVMNAWYDQNHDLINRYVQVYSIKDTGTLWGIGKTAFLNLRRRWAEEGRPVEKLIQSHYYPSPSSSQADKLPRYPEFNDNWPEAVQVEWLRIYAVLFDIDKGKSNAAS